MDEKGYRHWLAIAEDMRRSELKDYEYCLEPGFDVETFKRALRAVREAS